MLEKSLFGESFKWGVSTAAYLTEGMLTGYHPRFGLVHIDFRTPKRTVKQSGLWYRNFLADNQE